MLKTPWTLIIFSLLTFLLVTDLVFAEDRNWRRDRPNRRGNERSERVDRVQNDSPVYRGNGCPEGTARVVFAPDNLYFTVLLDRFVAEATVSAPPPGGPPNRPNQPNNPNRPGNGGNRGRGGRGPGQNPHSDRVTCNVIIPLSIPANMQMSITRVDYRGFVDLPINARGMLDSSFSFFQRNGRNGDDSREGELMRLRYIFNGPISENYQLSSDVLNDNGRPTPPTQLSPCGGRVRLRIQNDIRISLPPRIEGQGSLTVDSIDGSNNAVYQVNWNKCQSTRF